MLRRDLLIGASLAGAASALTLTGCSKTTPTNPPVTLAQLINLAKQETAALGVLLIDIKPYLSSSVYEKVNNVYLQVTGAENQVINLLTIEAPIVSNFLGYVTGILSLVAPFSALLPPTVTAAFAAVEVVAGLIQGFLNGVGNTTPTLRVNAVAYFPSQLNAAQALNIVSGLSETYYTIHK